VTLNPQYALLIFQSVGSVYCAGLYHVVWWVITNVSEQRAASILIVEMTQIGKVTCFYKTWGGGQEWPIRARDGKKEARPQPTHGNLRPWRVQQL
jgi:hypothetical protein